MRDRSVQLLMALIVVAGAGGCGQDADSPANSPATAANESAAVDGPAAAGPSTATEPAVQDIAQRRSELQARIDAAQAEQAQLQSEKLRIAALVESHQAEGEAQLAALKAQARALQEQSAGSQDAFAERARNQMEDALMLDQEYRGQLAAVEKQLDTSESRLRDLEAQLKALGTP